MSHHDMDLDLDAIAEDAVGEVFGFARPAVRLGRAIQRARDYRRGAIGSPAWRAAQAASSSSYSTVYPDGGGGGGYDPGAVDDMIEQEFGPDGEGPPDDGAYAPSPDGSYGEDPEEYGRYQRRWYNTKHPVRTLERRIARHRASASSQGSSSYPPPSPPQPSPYYPPQPSPYYPQAPVEPFGYDGGLPEPSQRDGTFVQSLKIGLGVGVGFAAVGLALGALSRMGRR